MRYPFPGNVRELENLIEGALALTVDPIIDPGDLLLPDAPAAHDASFGGEDLPTLDEWEARYIARVLAHTKGNLSKAAQILGVDRKTLRRRRPEVGEKSPSGEKWGVH
jgi:DNA-binding NtrC family response regulator